MPASWVVISRLPTTRRTATRPRIPKTRSILLELSHKVSKEVEVRCADFTLKWRLTLQPLSWTSMLLLAQQPALVASTLVSSIIWMLTVSHSGTGFSKLGEHLSLDLGITRKLTNTQALQATTLHPSYSLRRLRPKAQQVAAAEGQVLVAQPWEISRHILQEELDLVGICR